MKRDMDLARKILGEVERKAQSVTHPFKAQIDGYDEDQVSYHVLLLREAGLLRAATLPGDDLVYTRPIRSTWEGHEFLEAARNDNIWRRAKEIAGKAGSLTFDVLKPILIQLGIEAARGYLSPPPQT